MAVYKIIQLQEAYSSGEDPLAECKDTLFYDINSVAGVLKMYLRKLETKLIEATLVASGGRLERRLPSPCSVIPFGIVAVVSLSDTAAGFPVRWFGFAFPFRSPFLCSPLPFRERTEGRVSNRQVTKRCGVTEITVICPSSFASIVTENNHCHLPVFMKDFWKILA